MATTKAAHANGPFLLFAEGDHKYPPKFVASEQGVADAFFALRYTDLSWTIVPAAQALAAPALVEALVDMLGLYSCGRYGVIPEHWSDRTRQVIERARLVLSAAEGVR